MNQKQIFWGLGLFLTAFVIVAVSTTVALGQGDARPMYPSNSYNSEVPTPAEYLGYELGDDLAEHHLMVSYIHKLQELVPDLVKIE